MIFTIILIGSLIYIVLRYFWGIDCRVYYHYALHCALLSRYPSSESTVLFLVLLVGYNRTRSALYFISRTLVRAPLILDLVECLPHKYRDNLVVVSAVYGSILWQWSGNWTTLVAIVCWPVLF